MEARVEDEGLAGDHSIPSDARQDGQRKVRTQAVVAQQYDYRVKHDAQGGRQHAPEVQAIVALEAIQQRNEDLDAVEAGNGEEAGNGHVYRQGRRYGTSFPGHIFLRCRRTGTCRPIMARWEKSGMMKEEMGEMRKGSGLGGDELHAQLIK